MKEENILVTKLIFDLNVVNLRSWNQIRGNNFFLKNYGTSEGAVFVTTFYTINLFLLHETKKGFILIIILSNYQL